MTNSGPAITFLALDHQAEDRRRAAEHRRAGTTRPHWAPGPTPTPGERRRMALGGLWQLLLGFRPAVVPG